MKTLNGLVAMIVALLVIVPTAVIAVEETDTVNKNSEPIIAIKEAIANSDFDAFIEVVAEIDESIADEITEEQFDSLVVLYEGMKAAREDGDLATVRELRIELKSELFDLLGIEKRFAIGEVWQTIKEAIANNDFDAFIEVVAEKDESLADEITEEQFDSLVVLYEDMEAAREDGDPKTARELRDELKSELFDLLGIERDFLEHRR